MLLLWIILFSLLGSLGAIITASAFFWIKGKSQEKLVTSLISYATGTLLASAWLGIIPHALEKAPTFQVLATVLFGIIIFFLIEKLVIWHHCHNTDCQQHETAGPMILIGDAFHNFVDGIIIAAGFLISVPVGIATGLAIVAHEIPQELGDLAILLQSGYSKRKALLLNVLSGLISLPAAIIAYFMLGSLQSAIPFILSIAAASFIYIALTDLSPQLHKKTGLKNTWQQFILLLLGAATVIILLQVNI